MNLTRKTTTVEAFTFVPEDGPLKGTEIISTYCHRCGKFAPHARVFWSGELLCPGDHAVFDETGRLLRYTPEQLASSFEPIPDEQGEGSSSDEEFPAGGREEAAE